MYIFFINIFIFNYFLSEKKLTFKHFNIIPHRLAMNKNAAKFEKNMHKLYCLKFPEELKQYVWF